MEQILLILLVINAVALVTLILIQQGKGATIGAAFGSGASNTMFGSQGSGSFLVKVTSLLAAIFFILCIALANIAAKNARQSNVIDIAPISSTQQ